MRIGAGYVLAEMDELERTLPPGVPLALPATTCLQTH